ncbi:hypothetical protein, partial [Rhodopirellula bahusiensis]|uniref:hypothetical protein n=1 Tax=Rhodopirellula bahusiensis TaxID=2014065 RepID=UPI0032975E0B
VSSRVLTVDDQPVALNVPIGLIEDLLLPSLTHSMDWRPSSSLQIAATSQDRCALLCRWLN